jgi:hypothetical protein
MHILWKKESEMTVEEKRKLDLIRVLSIVNNNVDLGNMEHYFNMSEMSKLSVWADVLLQFFDIKHKDKGMEKDFFPEEFSIYPGHPEYEKVMSSYDQNKRAAMMGQRNSDRQRIASLLDQLVNKGKYVKGKVPTPDEVKSAPAQEPEKEEEKGPKLPENWLEIELTDDEKEIVTAKAKIIFEEQKMPTMGHALDAAKRQYLLENIDIFGEEVDDDEPEEVEGQEAVIPEEIGSEEVPEELNYPEEAEPGTEPTEPAKDEEPEPEADAKKESAPADKKSNKKSGKGKGKKGKGKGKKGKS